MFVLYIFFNSDKRSPRAGVWMGLKVGGSCFNKYPCFNDQRIVTVATRIQERRVREFGKSGNVVLL